jgi:hypothetical protein
MSRVLYRFLHFEVQSLHKVLTAFALELTLYPPFF